MRKIKNEKKVIARIVKEYNIFGFVQKRYFDNIKFDIDFFNRLSHWMNTHQGYNFWYEIQLKLCYIICKYDFKDDNKRMRFKSYLNFIPPFNDAENVDIKTRYKLLYEKIYNKKLS